MSRPSPTPELRALFSQAELDAERIVAILRILVALGLASFFVLTVRPPEPVENMVLIRQWLYASATMIAYLIMGGVTWLLIHRGAFRPWMLWPAAVFDAAFVVAGLWLGMQNTGLSGDMVFVFPGAWLVPVVLAFGVLRGNPAVMGFMIALIVLGLTALVATGGAPETSVLETTRMQIGLFLSFPPNIMRLAMISLAGLVLVVAALRTRTLLLRSLENAQQAANLTRYLPARMAPMLAQGGLETLRQGRRHPAAILFVDLVGFTARTQDMAPADVAALMTGYRSRIRLAVEQHGGLIDKFIGDGALVVFEDDADPVRAARACLSCTEELSLSMAGFSQELERLGQPPVQVVMGAHWGPVFSGVVGDEARLEYTVFGDTVNVASRLEQLTRSAGYQTLASAALVAQAGQDAEPLWHRLPDADVRGRTGPVPVRGRTAIG